MVGNCPIGIILCQPGVLTIPSQDFSDSSCDIGGGEEMEPSSITGRRIGGVSVLVSMAALSSAN